MTSTASQNILFTESMMTFKSEIKSKFESPLVFTIPNYGNHILHTTENSYFNVLEEKFFVLKITVCDWYFMLTEKNNS